MGRTPLLVRTLVAYVAIGAVVFAVTTVVHRVDALKPVVAIHAYAPSPIIGKAHYVIQGMPTRIVVPRLNIDLPIQQGTYDAKTGEWTLSNTSAYFATITDEPNDYKGSTFIYGHNRRSVFAAFSGVQQGDEVQIMTDNGHTFTYSYNGDQSVNPDVTSILYEHPQPPQLVVMTCEGLWSTTRRVMYFTLTGVTS
ncbi:MAG TPA: sortase [Dongiaceae bacterium]|nr:sortase [Dongiaceae bacterium]